SVGGLDIPPLVTQISDGENGGAMMNEFPGAFKRAWHDMGQGDQGRRGVVGMNGTEYLELIEAAGVKENDLPICQAIGHAQLWQQIGTAAPTPEAVATAIDVLKQQVGEFVMEKSAWTNNRSWISEYPNVLQPMEQLSVRFHEAVAAVPIDDRAALYSKPAYLNALLHNLLLQTSCFQCWGQGVWTDYAREIYRQGLAALKQGFR
ncbi:MAG: glycosyl hydrolase family 57, partial [Cyanobacteria bacterium P01_A01_bin.114]